jgi:hypothetical protein
MHPEEKRRQRKQAEKKIKRIFWILGIVWKYTKILIINIVAFVGGLVWMVGGVRSRNGLIVIAVLTVVAAAAAALSIDPLTGLSAAVVTSLTLVVGGIYHEHLQSLDDE